MKIQTEVKADGVRLNHNQIVVQKSLKVQRRVQAEPMGTNHATMGERA